MSIKVLVADDDAAVRDALATLINRQGSLELVGLAKDADEAIDLAASRRPDVVLIDVRMPGGGGARAAREIRRHSPYVHLIALSAHEDEQSVEDMLSEGVTSYLVKGASAQDILHAIQRAAEGGAALSESVTTHVAMKLAHRLGQERRDIADREDKTARIRGVLGGETGVSMVFQPIADLERSRVVGLEALARFSGLAARTPDVWFAEAAEVGLGVEFEMVAARAALDAFSTIPQKLFLSINASPEAVMSSRLDDPLRRVPAERVVLEITEHAPVTDYPRLKESLTAYRELGVRLAVDDAGAGFASLRHILQLDPDFIKLDISITRGIDVEKSNRSLASALASFAREGGITLVAEGVETAEEIAVLEELGIRLVQGYFVGRPGPLKQGFTVPNLRRPP